LVRHLIDLHHGAIDATSDGVGKGTEFTVRLPLRSTTPLTTDVPDPLWDPAVGRVMIVDDDVDSGESMTVLLGIYGYDVRRATDLQSALQVGLAFRPQAVLMDISMPDADGYEVARQLRAIADVGMNVSFIAVTGLGRPSDFKRSEEAGFAHHLVKPLDPKQLDRILRQTMKRDRPA
jgi:two-component system CheB/CheR fusion protein